MACSFQNTQHYSVIDLKNGGRPEIHWFIKTYIRVIQSDRPKNDYILLRYKKRPIDGLIQ